MPITNLATLMMGSGRYLISRSSARREVVSIRGDSFEIRWGIRTLTEVYEIQHNWVKVVLTQIHNAWYPSHLTVRTHGKEVEIGSFILRTTSGNL